MQSKKRISFEARRQLDAYKFVTHWIIGLLMFFIVPIINSIKFAFNSIELDAEGLQLEFVGLKFIKEALNVDPDFLNNLRDSISHLVYVLPIIVSLSLILAIILNQKFVGCTVARAIFFLPVIISTSIVLNYIGGGGLMNSSLMNITSGEETAYGSMIDFESILAEVNLPTSIITLISDYLTSIFTLIWDCGIQTILFLSGLQNIPASLYEVSKIEGANKWDEFWFVTVPMLRNIFPLVIIYTMIEIFTSARSNPVMSQISTLMNEKQVYDLSSAMLWLYFIFAFAIVGLIIFLYNHFLMKRWE